MARALVLAERGRGTTGPNPLVGAVVVDRLGRIIASGAHLEAGGPHAEVVALDAAGAAAAGGTLYCTLEPCCHHGRTGPCVERILEAGIARVVSAIEDPNPQVAGGGHAWLRRHGIDVDLGIAAEAARWQNAPFLTWITQQRPWTVLKTTVSADGFVAGPDRAPVKLSGADADRWMHRQRAWLDAIAVGAGTVLADDPQLTARGAWRRRPLTRVVIDWRGRVPASARVYSTLSAGPVIMVGLSTVAAGHLDVLRTAGVEVEVFEARDLTALGRRLAARGVQSLLVEGGPELQEAWCHSAPVDHVQWLRTPQRLTHGIAASAALVAWAARARSGLPLGADELFEGAWTTDVHGAD
jgi:diaminohydroxyphosphoribosylaminopyrimidine deaminase/5-amino-6-(5-phosphoribosylamino)uracil reductase